MNTLRASTDLELLESFNSGNQKAFETLVRRHQKQIYTAALVVVRDRYVAEDILQETFIKFFKELRTGRYEERNKMQAYLVRISHNLAIDYVRKSAKIPLITNVYGKDIFDFLNIDAEISLDDFDGDIEKERLRWAIHKLPDEVREMVLLRCFAQMSYKDISELINVNQNSCLGRMHKAVQLLKKYLVPKEKRYDQKLYPK